MGKNITILLDARDQPPARSFTYFNFEDDKLQICGCGPLPPAAVSERAASDEPPPYCFPSQSHQCVNWFERAEKLVHPALAILPAVHFLHSAHELKVKLNLCITLIQSLPSLPNPVLAFLRGGFDSVSPQTQPHTTHDLLQFGARCAVVLFCAGRRLWGWGFFFFCSTPSLSGKLYISLCRCVPLLSPVCIFFPSFILFACNTRRVFY